MRHDITKNIKKIHGRFYLDKSLDGARHRVDLHATNSRQAEKVARKVWREILNGKGGELVLPGRRGEGAARPIPTVSQLREPYLAAAIKPSRATREYNLNCLKIIAREALDISKAAAGRLSVGDVVNPDTLTGWIKIREMRPPRLSKAERAARRRFELSKPGALTPADLNRVRNTICATVKHARAIFSKACLDPEFGCMRNFNIPELSGFMRLPLPELEGRVYAVPKPERINAIIGGLPALEESSPAVFIGLLLALGMGLRRGEIIHARWDMIHWEEEDGQRVPVLRLGATHDWAGTKGKRQRAVEIPATVYAALLKHQDNPNFLVPNKRERAEVIKSGKGHFATQRPGRQGGPDVYRRSKSGSWGLTHDINRWLVSTGWDRRQKIHEMRKYFGALVATETGSLYEAKELLGHARIETTAESYAGLVKRSKFSGAVDRLIAPAANAI